ncbi:AraC family transcriptional regulator [Sphingobacterium detergens]|uniref:AraC-like DNA-binding protein n=1 Tax=Sphingobacterium detergens TaxID=1145106 RepID=A0A420BK91_SPHD1|nr:AraC family transcriptional regulator [Sphingobacterium detergens]RKE57097.1 AraC-like DNA-binding protein [Sphingobacterium detergens]
MNKINTFDFTPISNNRQLIHTISFAERIEKGKESVLTPHRANFYILLFVTAGVSKHLIDFEVHPIEKGDFLIIRPGQVHAFFSTEGADGTIIAFTADFLLHKSDNEFISDVKRFLNELSYGCLFNIEVEKRQQVNALTEMIQQELSTTYDELQEGILQSYLSSLLLILLRIKRRDNYLPLKKSSDFHHALLFKGLLEKHYEKQYKVAQYAGKMGISIRNLQKLTERYFGKSPKTVIQEHLILESKRMLIDPSLQVKEIAYLLGFNEPTNFTKFFKKYTKLSPEQFRKSLFHRY